MVNLTDEQQSRLDALLAELETLPIPELIVEAMRIRYLDWSTDEGKSRYRTAMAGGIAAQKMMAYLLALRDFEQFRDVLGRAVHEHKSRPQPTRREDIQQYALANAVAIHNSGLQEVAIHFFCNCVMHLFKLLEKAAEGAGYEIPEQDLAVLNAYRPLRNYYEHIENRLPGHANAREFVRETITEDEWHIQAGLKVDDQGRTILKGQPIDVTGRGMERIEDVVRKTFENFKPAALDGMCRYYEDNPEDIPGPEEVQHDLLVS